MLHRSETDSPYPFPTADPASVPTDLANLLSRSEKVPRFQFEDKRYPRDLVVDNVKNHTLRMVGEAEQLPLQQFLKMRVKRACYGHDLTEVETGDYTNIDKELDRALTTRLVVAETRVAQELLSDEDRQLLLEFNTAKGFLSKETDDVAGVTETGILSRVLDTLDGNMMFHQGASTWMKSDSPPFDPQVTATALTYTFRQQRDFREQLQKLPDSFKDIIQIVNELLQVQLTFVRSVWAIVPEEKIPQVIKDQLALLLSSPS